MEDSHTAELQLDEDNRTKNAFFAVYDGHGGMWFLVIRCRAHHLNSPVLEFLNSIGATVAKYAGTNVFKRLAAEQTYKDGSYQEGLKTAFLGTDEDILKSDIPEPDNFHRANGRIADPDFVRDPSGCTAVAALITEDDRIFVVS